MAEKFLTAIDVVWPPEDLVLTVDPVQNGIIFKEWKEKHGFMEY